jgi:N-methylhydantoinase A
VEVVGVIAAAIGRRSGPTARFRPVTANGRDETTRLVYFSRGGWIDTAIVPREALSPGSERSGPLIIEEALSTTLVPPGAHLSVHPSGSLLIDLPLERIQEP